jgi:hypothetical protein
MPKRVPALVLAGLLLSTVGVKPAQADSKEEKQVHFIEKVKQEVRRLGIGEDARVEVRLRDKANIKGYVGEVNEDSFSVVNPATRSVTTVAYPQVRQVKGNNLSTGAVVGIVAGAVFLVALLANIFGD